MVTISDISAEAGGNKEVDWILVVNGIGEELEGGLFPVEALGGEDTGGNGEHLE